MMELHGPDHLAPVTEGASREGDTLRLTLRCPCGGRRFRVEKTAFSSAEQQQIDEYEAAVKAVLRCSTIRTRRDAQGQMTVMRKRGLFGRWEPLLPLMPQAPAFIDATALRSFCRTCGREMLLFDSRLHGFEAACGECAPESLTWQPGWQEITVPDAGSLMLEIVYDVDEEDVREFLPSATPAVCRNAFGQLRLCSGSETGGSETLFEATTA